MLGQSVEPLWLYQGAPVPVGVDLAAIIPHQVKKACNFPSPSVLLGEGIMAMELEPGWD